MKEEGGRSRPAPHPSSRSGEAADQPVPPSPRGKGACVGGEGPPTNVEVNPSVVPPATLKPQPSTETWATALRDALLTVLTPDDVDVTTDAEPGVLEVSTDDWTLRIENLSPTTNHQQPTTPSAWLAIDDEPEDPARYRSARRAVMSPAIDRALAAADATLAGALRAALIAGADPFTQDLVAAL